MARVVRIFMMSLEGGSITAAAVSFKTSSNYWKEWTIQIHAFLVAGPVSLKKKVKINAAAIP